MSTCATIWAWRQRPAKSSEKLILLSLADRANEDHEAYPSVQRLELDTGLNRKTVMRSIDALIAQGLVEDTGHRRGRTGRVRVLRLIGVQGREYSPSCPGGNGPKNGTVKASGNGPKNNPVKNGNGPKNGTVNGPKNGTTKQYQNWDLEPPIGNLPDEPVFGRPAPETEKTTAPVGFEVTADLRSWAALFAPAVTNLELETEKFLGHHRAAGTRYRNWVGAWQKWIATAQGMALANPRRNPAEPGTPRLRDFPMGG